MQQVPQMPQLPQLPPPPAPPALSRNQQISPSPRISPAPQTAMPGGNVAPMELEQLRAHADALKLRVSDLEVQQGQIAEDRANVFPAERQKFAQPWAQVTHELAAARIQLDATYKQISELEAARQARVAVTVAPSLAERGIEMDMERERMLGLASFLLLLPLVLAWSRRLWHRGRPQPSVDLENSPRLQRMEQAIESIAVEVERIGEAQRFTTKLLSERQPEAAQRMVAQPRREPGTITPH